MSFKDSWNEYRANRGFNLYSRAVTVVLGVVMIVVGVLCLIKLISVLDQHMSIHGYPLLIPAGILVILTSRKPPKYAVLITTVTLALCVLIKLFTSPYSRPVTDIVVTLVYCAVLLYSAASYCMGNRHNAWRITILVAIHAVLLVGNIAFSLYLSVPWQDLWKECTEEILALVFCFTFIYYLQQPAVKEDSVNKLMRTGVSSLEAVAVSRPTVYIREAALKEMLGQTTATWKFYKEGPLASEGRSEIVDQKKVFECSSKVWRGENFIRVSFDRVDNDSTYGNGFEIRNIVYTDEDLGRFVYLYGREGFFVKLRVVSEEEEQEQNEAETERDDSVEVR